MEIRPRKYIASGNIVFLSPCNKIQLKLKAFHNRNTRRTYAAQHTRRVKMSRNNLCLNRGQLFFRF